MFKKFSQFIIVFFLGLIAFLSNPIFIQAQETEQQKIVEGIVIDIKESGSESVFEEFKPYQILGIQLTNGDERGSTIEVKN